MYSDATLNVDSLDASLFLTAIFEWFDNAQIPYCVQRNYHGYPDKLTGDVDLVVPQGQADSISAEIRNLAENLDWRCYIEHSGKNTSHLGFYKPVYPNRFVLVIELFAGASWHGISYLSASDILSHRIRYGITWRPLPAHQAIITTIHHLLYNGHVPIKYREELVSLVMDDPQLFYKELGRSFGNMLATYTLKGIIGGSWEVPANKVKRYKLALLLNSFRSPIVFATSILQASSTRHHIPEGVVLLVYCDDKVKRENLCDALWNLADCWHIFLPPFRKIINCDESDPVSKALDIRTIYRVVHRGGVVIAGCDMASNVDLNLSLAPYRIICTKTGCTVCAVNNDNIEDYEALKISENNLDLLVPQIWDFILRDRVYENMRRRSANNT